MKSRWRRASTRSSCGILPSRPMSRRLTPSPVCRLVLSTDSTNERRGKMTACRWIAPLLACAALAGCATVSGMKEDVSGLFQSSKGQKELDAGVKAYDDGDYPQAVKQLQASLDAGLSGKTNVARAHKYLAFTYCVTERISQCRDQFGK